MGPISLLVMRKFNQLKVRTKIMVLYFTLVILGVGLSAVIYLKMSGDYYEATIYDLSVNEITNNNHSLELLLQDINNFSKEIISNANIQEVLDPNYQRVVGLKQVDQELTGLINFDSKISSIYIFDFNGNRYYRDKAVIKTLTLEDIMVMPWYEDLLAKQGGYLYNFDGDGLITEDHYLSFFRLINSNLDHQPIGIMMINIDQGVIKENLNLTDDTDHLFVIRETSHNTSLVIAHQVSLDYQPYFDRFVKDKLFYEQMTIENNIYSISGYGNDNHGWEMIKLLPKEEKNQFFSTINMTIISMITLNAFLLIYGSFYIARYITRPMIELTDAMKGIEKGEFMPVDVPEHYDEIGSLKNGYNYMIVEIQRLIQEIIEEQESLKQAELRVLMEQMKPHFMYNTLDSISALMVLNRQDEAHECLNALSRFYRHSLSDGRLIITIGQELDILKDYLFIQGIRYRDLFVVTYKIDESLLDYTIPKLILQPLVENSLYHGIRPMGAEGEILIRVKATSDDVLLEVKDNGCGIPEDKLRALEALSHVNTGETSSIGLPATMRRIQHRYGNEGAFVITSSKQGTTIQLRLPLTDLKEVRLNDIL